MGLLCLAIKNSRGYDVGRTKLQKMIYFADRYLDWDVGDYKLHYYGPYSRNVALTIKMAREILIEETVPDRGPYKYSVTRQGEQFLADFAKHARDDGRIRRAEKLFGKLSEWDREQLEIAATIDYVQRGNPDLVRDKLLERVKTIKDNFQPNFIDDVYGPWDKLKSALLPSATSHALAAP